LIESRGYETDDLRKNLVTYRKSEHTTGYNTEDVQTGLSSDAFNKTGQNFNNYSPGRRMTVKPPRANR
jgi:hypothetical protein